MEGGWEGVINNQLFFGERGRRGVRGVYKDVKRVCEKANEGAISAPQITASGRAT